MVLAFLSFSTKTALIICVVLSPYINGGEHVNRTFVDDNNRTGYIKSYILPSISLFAGLELELVAGVV